MIDPGASTEELIEAVRERLRVMERCAQTRRNRQQGTDALTDLFLCIEGLGRRLGLIEWDESVSAGDEDEDDLIEEYFEEPYVKVTAKYSNNKVTKSKGVEDIHKLPLDWFNTTRQNYKINQIIPRKKEIIIDNKSIEKKKI